MFIYLHKSNQIQSLLYDIKYQYQYQYKSQPNNKMSASLAKHWTNQLDTINLSYCDLLFGELTGINRSHYARLKLNSRNRKGKMVGNGDQTSKASFLSNASTLED